MRVPSLRTCCPLLPPGRPNAGDARLCRWLACPVRRLAICAQTSGAFASMKRRRTSVAHNKPCVWICCASPIAASGAATVSLDVVTYMTMSVAETPSHRYYFPLHCVVHVAVGWRPHLLTCYAMYGRMLTLRSAHHRAIVQNLHPRLLAPSPG